MDNENSNWDKISEDITEAANKIKKKVKEEDLVEDLRNSLRNTIDSTSELFENLLNIIDSTIKDEDIKQETIEVIKKINEEISVSIKETSSRIFNLREVESSHEEE